MTKEGITKTTVRVIDEDYHKLLFLLKKRKKTFNEWVIDQIKKWLKKNDK